MQPQRSQLHCTVLKQTPTPAINFLLLPPMGPKLNSTALLLFVRDEREEAQLKPLAGNRSASAALFRCFNALARQQARKTGLPLFVVKGQQQQGRSFGERFANALESIYDRGFERVIALGNDCLQLQPSHILQAAELMQRHGLVLGPAVDGGVYILGISRTVYEREAFIALPWQTAEVGAALRSYAAHYLLPQRNEDIDDWQSFQRQLGRVAGYLRKQLMRFAVSSSTPSGIPSNFRAVIPTATVGLRAPPF